MATRQTNKLQIPVDISRFVVVYGLQKAFAIFLYLKFHSSGKLHKDSPVFKSVMKALRISDDRTYRKHFNKLIELNWINLNESSGIYHFRGFDRLRIEYNIRTANLSQLRANFSEELCVYIRLPPVGATIKKRNGASIDVVECEFIDLQSPHEGRKNHGEFMPPFNDAGSIANNWGASVVIRKSTDPQSASLDPHS